MLASRRPVVDATLRVTGYRIAYSQNGLAADRAGAVLKLLDDAMSVIGGDEPYESRVAHLPISRESLLAVGVPPVRPDRVILRLDYTEARDPALEKVLDRLVYRGYSLELDGLPGPDFDLRLLDAFGTVEIDFATWTGAEITAVLPKIFERRARPLATNVSDHDQFEWACSQGFDLFDGPF